MQIDESIRKKVRLVTVVTAFMTTFMSSALNLSIPDISTEFGVSAGAVGWIVTAYTLTVAAFCVPMGRLADRSGRRRILRIGLAVFTVLTFLCLAVRNIGMFIALRSLQGIAAAMIFSTNNAILLDVHPDHERGKALGISTGATYIGLSAGPVIGGMINHQLGWHYIFVFGGLVGAAAYILSAKGTPQDRPAAAADAKGGPADMDVRGAVIYVLMILSLLYGISLTGSSPAGWALAGASLVLLVCFAVNEKRAESPIIRLEMFTRDRAFTCSNLAALLNYGATFAISYLISIYLQVVLGYSSQKAGLILVIMPAIQAAFSPMMGRLSDRVAAYKLASAGMGFCVITLLWYTFTLQKESAVYIVIALILGGIGFALFSSPNNNAIMSRVHPKERGTGNAIVSTMRTVGQSFSMCAVTIIVNVRLGDVSLQAAGAGNLTQTIRICFMIFAAICAVGAVISMSRGGLQKKNL